MLTRILLGLLVAVTAVMVASAVIAALALPLAVGLVLFIMVKIGLPKLSHSGEGKSEIVTVRPVRNRD